MDRRLTLTAAVLGVAAVAVAAGVFIATRGPHGVGRFASLQTLAGRVDVRPRRAPRFTRGRDGESLATGDTVRTGSDGRADVHYFDTSLTQLSPRTELTLTELASRGRDRTIRLHQTIGRTLNRIARLTGEEDRVQLTTPAVVLTVRGTVFEVVVAPDGTTTVRVIEGIVDATSRGRTVTLRAGDSRTFPPPGSPPGPPATTVEAFQAFDASGNLRSGLTATSSVTGSCFAASSAAPRSDAFRCFVGSDTLVDPCFVDQARPASLACVPDPFSNEVTLLTVTDPLPPANGGSPGDVSLVPWALRLADGTRCVIVTGATSAIDDLRANYGCTDGRTLWGDPDRTGSTWTILASTTTFPLPKRSDLVPVAIGAAVT